jgi:DNA-binding MarR family transcriptional regulator
MRITRLPQDLPWQARDHLFICGMDVSLFLKPELAAAFATRSLRTRTAVLLTIWGSRERGMSTLDMATILTQRPSNLVSVCKVLEKDGLLTKHQMFGDRRSLRFFLTYDGYKEAQQEMAALKVISTALRGLPVKAAISYEDTPRKPQPRSKEKPAQRRKPSA